MSLPIRNITTNSHGSPPASPPPPPTSSTTAASLTAPSTESTSTVTAASTTIPSTSGPINLPPVSIQIQEQTVTNFNNAVQEIIPSFSLTQEQFESNSIDIDLSRKNLDSQTLSQFLKLCADFGIEKKITTLHLYGNQLTSLPSAIEDLTALTFLGLSSQ